MEGYDDHPKLENYPIDREYCRRTEERDSALERSSSSEEDSDDEESVTIQIGDEEFEISEIDISVIAQETDFDTDDADRLSSVDYSFLFGNNAGDAAATSLDELIDANAVIENDGRSDTRTFYYMEEVDSKADKSRWARMLKMQDGVGDTTRSSKNAAADKRRWADAFCTQLDCTPLQNETVKELIKELNFKYFGNYSSEKVILGMISLACERDNRFIRHEPDFQRLMKSVNLDHSGLRTCRRMVRERSQQFSGYEPS